MGKAKTRALVCRQNLFREQITRLQRLEERRPTLQDARQLWCETGFKTA